MAGRIHVLATVYLHADLLPHFVSYYRDLGVDEIHLLVNESGMSRETRELVDRYHPLIRSRYCCEYTSLHRTQMEMKLKDGLVGEEDYFICVDLDEFHEYPLPLRELPALFQEQGLDFAEGPMVDHLAADGTLPPITTENLWDQFPLEAALTERLAGGDPNSVMFCRKQVVLRCGRHRARGVRAPFGGIVHHFKWHARLVPLLNDRCRIMENSGSRFAAESRRVLEHLEESGRIRLDEFPGRPGTYRPDYCTASYCTASP